MSGKSDAKMKACIREGQGFEGNNENPLRVKGSTTTTPEGEGVSDNNENYNMNALLLTITTEIRKMNKSAQDGGYGSIFRDGELDGGRRGNKRDIHTFMNGFIEKIKMPRNISMRTLQY
jgi:hypothetical protein